MSNLVIVALPSRDDYIHKISSEKVPHLTLLFLGEVSTKVKNLDKIIGFVKHAADTSLMTFALDVERRGTLGEASADVLFFSKSKWGGLDRVNEFRSNLLKDNNIRTAYESTKQHPEWLPHITLGYPETPAKPDERDYPGTNYVRFDRIAVWDKEYDGVEIPLKTYSDMDMAMSDISTSERVEEFLTHFGVKGMKWGVRNDRTSTSGALSGLSGAPELRKDERWQRKIRGNTYNPRYTFASKANVKLMNKALKSMKSDVDTLNKKPEYQSKQAKKEIKRYMKRRKQGWPPDTPITKKYDFEHTGILSKHLRSNFEKQTSPSGKWETSLWVSKSRGRDYSFTVWYKKNDGVKHAADDSDLVFRLRPIFDDEGYIVDYELLEDDMTQSSVDEFLEHFGVKGMKWGVRNTRERVGDVILERGFAVSTTGSRARAAERARNRAAKPVKVTQKGKKLKTSGGKGRSAHPDAVLARTIGQVAKKSGHHALSNEELKIYSQRLQLEQNAKRLRYNEMNPGKKFVSTLLGKSGNSLASEGINKGTKEVGKRAIKLATAR